MQLEHHPIMPVEVGLTCRSAARAARSAILAFIILHSAFCLQAMDRFAALSQIESGDNDRAVGRAGEVSRYQITPAVWRQYTVGRTCRSAVPADALIVAHRIMRDRISHYIKIYKLDPGSFTWYLLWNCPADVNHPSKPEAARAARFANLCSKP